ncbi:MAG: TIGR03620 family F420-dependent LLM class oxidoreductase [Aeromicrobium sp.]
MTASGRAHPFGRVGVWVGRRTPPDEQIAIAQAAHGQGYGAVWLSGGLVPGIFDDLERILYASGNLPVGSSVLNIWTESAGDCAAHFDRLEQLHPGRLFLGLGVSHAPAIAQTDYGTYEKPLAKMSRYLDNLAAATVPIPVDRLMIGALGPKMLQMARERTRGSVPYLVATDHPSAAREALGPDAVLAPELTVAVDDDLQVARAAARAHLSTYLGLPNYTNNFARFGFGPEHLDGGGSDALLDAVYGIGSPVRVAERITAHLEAGADHVAVQIAPIPGQSQAEAFARLAPAIRM